MKLVAIALLLALVGCGVEQTSTAAAWDIGTRPIAAPDSPPAWAARVDAARDQWSALLVAQGCADPFDGSLGTQPVALVADMSGHGTAIGWTDRTSIEVLGTADDLAHYPTYGHSVLMHELGHALGLVHVAPADDSASIMHAVSDSIADPDAIDVADVANLIGCGR